MIIATMEAHMNLNQSHMNLNQSHMSLNQSHMSLNQSHEQTFILPGQLYILLWFLIEELFLIMFFYS